MNGLASGTAIGALIAVILAGAVVGVLDLDAARSPPPQPAPPRPDVVRLGPDGTAATFFGDDVADAAVPGSRHYDLCYGEMRVQRPAMITTDMPDAFCSVTRQGRKKAWRMTTGGWQQCQAVCIRVRH